MINKKIGFIGCGNMGGAILYGALESGVLDKGNAYVYDINPAMMKKAEEWGVHLAADDEDLCAKSDIILLAVKPQNAAEALAMCKKALDGKSMMSIVAGVTVERLRAMIDGTPRILRLLPNTPAMVFEGAFAICSDNDFLPEDLEKGIHPGELKDMVTSPGGTTIEGCEALERGGMRGAVIDCINKAAEKSKKL